MLRESETKVSDKKNPRFETERVFDAPRKLVFEAWSKAEHVMKWFAPKPLAVPRCELDLRAGGVFYLVMRMPDGTELPMDGKFIEVVENERIVFSAIIHDDNRVHTTVTFSDVGTKTKMHVVQTYSYESPATRGAPQGWASTLDQLGEFAKRGMA
jgi:uncharacterized protein YndB with AHSA1/START domain